MPAPIASSRLSFGLYEVDLQTGELWKAGFRVKLQSQPFKVLAALLEHPGQVVTREELQLRLWGKDTIVDFDHSLGTAVNKIREALGDSAENPRFIETLARRGYRFIAPVTVIDIEPLHPAHVASAPPSSNGSTASSSTSVTSAEEEQTASEAPATAVQPVPEASASFLSTRQLRYGAAATAAVAIAAAAFYAGSLRSGTSPPHITQITHNGHLAPNVGDSEGFSPNATDGVHLYATTIEGGRAVLSAISLTEGVVTPLNVPSEVSGPALGDISPDGSRLLLRDHLSPESEQPLWVVPTLGGSALRVGNVLAHDATWMPATSKESGSILYASGNNLYLTSLTGNTPQPYATLPGRAFWLRWSPGGDLLRFTVVDPIAHTSTLWQLSSSDRNPQPILRGFNPSPAECCGVWTADGKSFVFQSTSNNHTDLWQLRGHAASSPTRLTDGPLQYESPTAARTGSRIYFLGTDARSELYTVLASGQLRPIEGFLATAVRVDYSRDGRWVAWTDDAGRLWRARSDGSELLQLTPENFSVFLAHWSPDGSRLALMGRGTGESWRLYLLSANGGSLEPLLRESRNAADPSWSPNGKSLAFGRVNDLLGKESGARNLQILHLGGNQVEPIPGSEGLFSPRWSPDGKYIAALSLDQREVRLYSVATHTWSKLPVASGADPVWSADSLSLFVHASLDPEQPILRISIPDGHVEAITRLANSGVKDAVDFIFGGLTRDNQPIVRSRVFTGNVYSLDLK
ncbi:MAG TPA: winged helix-turn-helix domain-containing protein [Granulicella sp.]